MPKELKKIHAFTRDMLDNDEDIKKAYEKTKAKKDILKEGKTIFPKIVEYHATLQKTLKSANCTKSEIRAVNEGWMMLLHELLEKESHFNFSKDTSLDKMIEYLKETFND